MCVYVLFFVYFGRTNGSCFTMAVEEEGGHTVLTAGCLALRGSEFQCRVSLQFVSLCVRVRVHTLVCLSAGILVHVTVVFFMKPC